MAQPLDRTAKVPQLGKLDEATGEFWREQVFEMGAGTDNLSAYEPNRLYLNIDGTQFLDGSFCSGSDIDSDSRSVVAGDFDRDGALDLLVGSVGGGPLRMFLNQFPDGHKSMRLRLVGSKSNRSAIGARATAWINGRAVVRDLFSANGCLGQGPAELHLGVGDAEKIDRLEIRWPTGDVQTYQDVPVGGIVSIVEGESDFEFAQHHPGTPLNANGLPSYLAIDTPRFDASSQAHLAPDERVLGIRVSGKSRAYPLKYLQSHHLCHDEISGEPILVSYCPPTRSSTAFERRLTGAGQELTLTFDVAGMVKSVGYTVLRDRQTKSLWSPITGQCLQGPLRGSRLKPISRFSVRWQSWLDMNPATDVLSPAQIAYRDLVTDDSNSASQHVDLSRVHQAVPPNALGLGIIGENTQVFVPLDTLVQTAQSFRVGQLDGRPIVVLHDGITNETSCYYASTIESGGVVNIVSTRNGEFTGNDGSIFDIFGRCIDGPLKGERLEPITNACEIRWYAWNLTFPRTQLVQTRN